MLTSPYFSRSVRPIFIIGAPRSGTSITTWAVGQLPNVQPLPETNWLATLAMGAFLSHGYGSSRGRFSHLSNVDYELAAFMRRVGEAADAIVHDCFEERCVRLYGDYRKTGRLEMSQKQAGVPFQIRLHVDDPKHRWIDGTPYNTFFAWALSMMFPDALFIHNLRRPDDVATSLEGFDKLGQDSHELVEGLKVWVDHTEQARVAERAFGSGKIYRLNFERISQGPEELFREVAAFIEEDYTDDCLRPLKQKINSSQVDDKRAENQARLAEIPEFQACSTLYRELCSNPPVPAVDAIAMDALRDRFVEYCSHHPMI